MWQQLKNRGLLIAIITVLVLSIAQTSHAQPSFTTRMGTLKDGATYLMEVPSDWNGTLFLYSHGYVVPGSANSAMDVGDPATRVYMLANGFAPAVSSYATTAWAIHEALEDQIAVLRLFDSMFGHPSSTIAWGHSLGGIITAAVLQRKPQRFCCAPPLCGGLSRSAATLRACRARP